MPHESVIFCHAFAGLFLLDKNKREKISPVRCSEIPNSSRGFFVLKGEGLRTCTASLLLFASRCAALRRGTRSTSPDFVFDSRRRHAQARPSVSSGYPVSASKAGERQTTPTLPRQQKQHWHSEQKIPHEKIFFKNFSYDLTNKARDLWRQCERQNIKKVLSGGIDTNEKFVYHSSIETNKEFVSLRRSTQCHRTSTQQSRRR